MVEGDTDVESDDDTINAGDKVRIADSVKGAGVYDVYGSWIEKYAPEYAIHYAYGVGSESVELCCDYFVLKKAERDAGNCEMLCLISTSRDPISNYQPCYLIAEKDLKKVAQ